MKKLLKIIFVILLCIYAVVATIAATSFSRNNENLKKTNDNLRDQYESLLDEQMNTITEDADLIVFNGIADCISETNCVSAFDNNIVILAVYAEGRSMNEVVNTISEYAFPLASALEISDYPNALIFVMTDNNEVWFGYTVSQDGSCIPFLSESTID